MFPSSMGAPSAVSVNGVPGVRQGEHPDAVQTVSYSQWCARLLDEIVMQPGTLNRVRNDEGRGGNGKGEVQAMANSSHCKTMAAPKDVEI